jgi:transposase
MRAGKSLTVSSADFRRLKAVVQDRNAPQKHVWRAEIVLLTADGVGTNEIMRRTAKSKTCVWRWQERFLEDGFDGLLRDKTRPSRIKPLSVEATERVVALTLGDPPGETTHWTGALMAKAAGLSVSWECPESCARSRVFHQVLTKRSPNMMANWVLASAHSRGGIFHS